jgi:type I restriction enzyme S subunit
MSKISITTLGSLIEFQRGYDLPKSSFIEGIVPVISSNGILGFHNEYKVKGPGITIGRSGTVGLPHYIEVDFFPHNTALFVKDFKGNNPKYLFYLLKTLGLNDRGSGSGVPTMNRNHLHPLKVRAHLDISTQQKIASVLSTLDAKIELNNRVNAELEAMAKTLYDYWFVQFEFPFDFAQGKPNVPGVVAERSRGYKSSGGKMVYNAELKREIPDGWEVKKIGKVLSTKLGGTPSTEIKEYWINGEFHWLNSGEIANFPIITSELKITKKAIENSSTYLLPKGTIAISITRHIRPSILAIDSCANQSVIGILESKELKSSYLYPLIKNEIPRYLSLRTGAQQPHINKQTIDKTNIIIPNKETLKKYYQVSNHFYERIKNNAFQNQHLSELRDWLLPMLMNGQVTIAEAEKAVYKEAEAMCVAAEPEIKY